MTTSRNAGPIQGRGKENVGLLANGSSGEWEVAIDESTSGTERWYAQIEGPSVVFYFEIPSVDMVGKFLRFLTPRSEVTKRSPDDDSEERNGSLVIGKDKKTPIILVNPRSSGGRRVVLFSLGREKSKAEFERTDDYHQPSTELKRREEASGEGTPAGAVSGNVPPAARRGKRRGR